MQGRVQERAQGGRRQRLRTHSPAQAPKRRSVPSCSGRGRSSSSTRPRSVSTFQLMYGRMRRAYQSAKPVASCVAHAAHAALCLHSAAMVHGTHARIGQAGSHHRHGMSNAARAARHKRRGVIDASCAARYNRCGMSGAARTYVSHDGTRIAEGEPPTRPTARTVVHHPAAAPVALDPLQSHRAEQLVRVAQVYEESHAAHRA